MRWPVAGLLTVGVIIAYIDRINLSFALPEMARSFSLSPQSSGLLLSAFFWSYAALQVPAGWVVDRLGVKWPYAIAFLFWSVISASTALVGSLAALLAVRVLLGVGESIVTPAGMRYIRSHFAEKERGLAIGVFMSGTKYGPALGGPIAAYLVRDYGWQWMFVLTGAGCLLWLFPWVLLMRNGEGGVPAVAEPGATDRRTGESASWGAILASPVMWGTFLATFCYMYFVYFCMTWMPIYFKQRRGLSLTNSGWFTFMSFGGMATIAILAGFAADRLIGRGADPVRVRKIFSIAGFVLASSQIIGAFTNSIPVALFFAVFSLSGLGLTTANYWALTQTLMPGSVIGRVAGIQNTAANLAGVVSPWVTGVIIHQTGRFDAPLVAIGFWLLVGIGCYVFLVREKYAPGSLGRVAV
ncbi:MAG: MFS transporter [Acidobacteria bacterium]|nr:MFS transporter [Acidobacteriota bacterium]